MKAWVNTGSYWVFFFLLGYWISGLVFRARAERVYEERFADAIRYGFESGLLSFGPEAGNGVLAGSGDDEQPVSDPP